MSQQIYASRKWMLPVNVGKLADLQAHSQHVMDNNAELRLALWEIMARSTEPHIVAAARKALGMPAVVGTEGSGNG